MELRVPEVPLPRFPPELLVNIFSHCSPATLAVVSRVSSSCLALSAAFLYEDITLDDDLSLALLLRIPHPLTNSAFDPVHPDFKTSHPNGFPVPSPGSPNRISPYTSLTLIHSLTYTGLSHLHPRPLDYIISLDPATLPPKLTLPVLHISIASPASGTERSKPPIIARMMALLDPESLIITRRNPPPGTDPAILGRSWPTLKLWSRASNASWAPQKPLSRLSFVLLSQVHLQAFGPCLPPHSDQPARADGRPGAQTVRYLVDLRFLSDKDAAEGFNAIRSDAYEEVLDSSGEQDPAERLAVRAWVRTEKAREAVLEDAREQGQSGTAYSDVPGGSVVVPSERVAAWMKELRSGAIGKREMDRAVLEELRR